jgi:hypothetical protein
MEGRTIALAVTALGWLVASLVAFAFVVWFGFAGIGVMGLMLWFVCVRMELEKDAAVGTGRTPELIARQYEARERMSEEERAGWRHEQSQALQSIRFFRHLGIGLTAIGAAGLLYRQF